MKKLLLSAILLFCIASFGQISEYNKTTTFKEDFGVWMKNNSNEMFITNQTPVGYKKSYDELNRVLKFYGLDISEWFSDNSLIPKGTSIQDFTAMSNNLYLEMAEINMMWKTKSGINIFFNCNNKQNGVLLNPIK